MTLIVGLKCKNGIVLGADGAATLGQPGQPTTTQPYVKKLSICHQSIVMGVSGPVGVGQRLFGILGDLYGDKKLAGKKTHQVMQALREAFWNGCLAAEHQIAALSRQIHPPAASNALCNAVVAMPVGDTLALMQFDTSAAPELATKDLPFLAIGSGQTIADPFLAFVRRIFWEDHEPNLADGQFAVWWTLHHAIKCSSGGVSDPKQIIVLERVKDKVVATELDQAHMDEHEVAIEAAESYIKKFEPTKKTSADASATPPIPEPPPQTSTAKA